MLEKLREVKDLAEGKLGINDISENDEDEVVEDEQILKMLDNLKNIVENIEIRDGEISDSEESLKLHLSEDDSLECNGSIVDAEEANVECDDDVEVEGGNQKSNDVEMNVQLAA